MYLTQDLIRLRFILYYQAILYLARIDYLLFALRNKYMYLPLHNEQTTHDKLNK